MNKSKTTIKIESETWILLRKKKLEVEEKLKRRVTWDEFFRMLVEK